MKLLQVETNERTTEKLQLKLSMIEYLHKMWQNLSLISDDVIISYFRDTSLKIRANQIIIEMKINEDLK